jgi:hypothetical protein
LATRLVTIWYVERDESSPDLYSIALYCTVYCIVLYSVLYTSVLYTSVLYSVLYSVCPKQLEHDLTFCLNFSSIHLLYNDRDATMIVEPKILVLNKTPSITAIETPMQGSDRFLLTIAERANGKSGQVGSEAVIWNWHSISSYRLRYSVSNHILPSQLFSATISSVVVALAFNDFRIRSISTLTLTASPLVLQTWIMLPISTASGQKWEPILMKLPSAAPTPIVTMGTPALGTNATMFVATTLILPFVRNV